MTDKVTNEALGEPICGKSAVLDTGAGMTQDLSPVKNICAFLNAFHVYANDTSRSVDSYHYCSHLNEDVRQCLIYDSPAKTARLIGIEYMITPHLYATLPESERKLWHSHVFEVKSGQLIMPKPSGIPTGVWEATETKEMEEVVGLYGKTYHFWQVDRGDLLPMGEPQLMASFTGYTEEFEKVVGERDRKMGVDHKRKKEIREGIVEPEIHPDADGWWKNGKKD